MKLTDRQVLIYNMLMDVANDDPDHGWIAEAAVKIDEAIPSLPAPSTGHLPPKFGVFAVIDATVSVDLDTFYEQVVMPSREAYMARTQTRVQRRADPQCAPGCDWPVTGRHSPLCRG